MQYGKEVIVGVQTVNLFLHKEMRKIPPEVYCPVSKEMKGLVIADDPTLNKTGTARLSKRETGTLGLKTCIHHS